MAEKQDCGATMMWLKKLNNPFLLGLEGFLAGAVLFFATHPGAADTIVGDRGAQSHQQQQQARTSA
jgi:hypothetical protein